MSTLISANPDAIHTDLGDESVVLLGESGQAFRLNVTARAIWLRLPATRDALCTALLETFEADAAQVRRDLDTVLATLLGQGLVHESAALA